MRLCLLILSLVLINPSESVDCPDEDGFEACTTSGGVDIMTTVYTDEERLLTSDELKDLGKSCEEWVTCKTTKNCTNLPTDYTDMCKYPQWYVAQAEECIRNFFYTAHNPTDKDYDSCAKTFDFFSNHLNAFSLGKECFLKIAKPVCNQFAFNFIKDNYLELLNILKEPGSCDGLRAKLLAPKCELISAILRRNESLPRLQKLDVCRRGVSCLEESCKYSETVGFSDFEKEHRNQKATCLKLEKQDSEFWKCAEKVSDSVELADYQCGRDLQSSRNSGVTDLCILELKERSCMREVLEEKCPGGTWQDLRDYLKVSYVYADYCDSIPF